jgi:hypothetical protein
MTDLRKSAEQALEALEMPIHEQPLGMRQSAVAALRAALAAPDETAGAIPLDGNVMHDPQSQRTLVGWTSTFPAGMDARRDAIELADALDRCCDELLIFGNDFSKPLTEAAAELRRLHAAHAHQYAMAGEMLRQAERTARNNDRLISAIKRVSEHPPTSLAFRTALAIAEQAVRDAEYYT